MEHLVVDDILAFFTRPSREIHARVTSHLLSCCTDCLEGAWSLSRSLGLGSKKTDSQCLAAVLQKSALVNRERERAPVVWARLADLEEEARLEAIQSRRGIRCYGFALYILDEAEGFATRGKSEKAVELLNFSAAVTEALSPRIYGVAPLEDLRLRQKTILSSVKRIELDFCAALEVLTSAEQLKNRGVDPAERARFYRVKASLLNDMGDFYGAATAAREAVCLYGEMSDSNSKAKALLQQALIVSLLDPGLALKGAEEGLSLLESPEPKPLLSGVYCKCYCLLKLGRATEAEHLLALHRDLIRQLADVSDWLWFGYIDALLLKAKGLLCDADALLQHLALRFREERLYQAMLFQHLERIRLKAQAGRWKAAVNIATRLTPELARLGLRNDLLGLWASLQDGLIQRRNVVDQVEEGIRRRWNAPVASRGTRKLAS